MSITSEPMPIAWPSLSDLARMLGIDLSTFSRLSSVRSLPTRRIGREVKVPPSAAITILMERGLSQEVAAAGIRQMVDHRMKQIPALRTPDRVPGAEVESRLVRSSFGSTNAARLTAMRIPYAGPRGPRRAAPDMDRFELRDRALGHRNIPIERYVYGD